MQDLLERWIAGDPTATEGIVERCLPWIRSRVRIRLGEALRRKIETGDAVQSALLQFLQYGPRFRVSSEDSLRVLLSRIVENVLRGDHDWFAAKRREMSRERPLSSDTSLSLDGPIGRATTPALAADRRERDAWIRLGLELMEPEDRRVLTLAFWDGLSFPEIGGLLEISPDSARMRTNRAVVRLGRTLGCLRRGNHAQLERESES